VSLISSSRSCFRALHLSPTPKTSLSSRNRRRAPTGTRAVGWEYGGDRGDSSVRTLRVSLAGSLLALGDLVFCLGEPLALSSLPPLPLSSLPPLLLGPSSPNSAAVDRARAASSSASSAQQPECRQPLKRERSREPTYLLVSLDTPPRTHSP
jgi:hypothetical protein